MSRPTRRTRHAATAAETRRGRSPLVWMVYVLGVLGAAVLVFSALFTLGGVFGSDDYEFNVAVWPLIVWGGLVVLAAATWLRRKRAARR